MIRKIIIAAMAAGLLGASAISIGAEDEAQAVAPAAAPVMNPMAPAMMSGFMNPSTHKLYHDAFLNPAQWAQFMQPQFYMQMANPALMMQWMNPASYQVMMDPRTYMYWMQPNVMMAEASSINPAVYMNPASYQAFMNPGTYMSWMNPAVYSMGAQQIAAPAAQYAAPAMGGNWFDMNAWSSFFQAAPATEEAKKDEG